MKKIICLGMLGSALFALAPAVQSDGHAAAEGKTPPLAEVWILVPKVGHRQAFEAALKEHIAFRHKAGDPRHWQTYSVALGEDLTPYAVRHCCFNWADQDAYTEWSSNPDLMAHFNEHVDPHVTRYAHTIDVIDWEKSQWPADGEGWSYVGVTEWRPKLGHGFERREAHSKMSGLSKEKGRAGRWLFYSSLTGPANLKLARPFNNFADMAPPEPSYYEFMVEHLGEEETRAMLEQFSGSFWSREYTVYQLRGDLSTPYSAD